MRAARLVPPLVRDNSPFAWFFAGQATSLVGDQISLIAFPLVGVIALDASATEMGLLTAAGLLPNLVFALPAGAWVDRRPSRVTILLAADLGRALLAGLIPLAYALDRLSMPVLYAVSFATGTLSVLFFVAYNTVFVSLVAKERVIEASSLVHGSRAFSFVAGPSVAGLLVQLLGAPLALIADGTSFLVSAFTLTRIDPREPAPAGDEHGGLLGGLRYIAGSSVMRPSLLATGTINFFNFMFWALFLLYASRELAVAPGILGLILGAGAIGGVIGSLVTSRIVRLVGIGRTSILGAVLFPAPLLFVPLAAGPRPLVLIALFLAEFGSGFGLMLLDIAAGSIAAALVPDSLRSRVSGAYMTVNNGVRPIGALLGGLVGSAIGLRPTLWIATVGALTGVLFLLPSPLRRMQALPEQDQLS